MKPIAYRIPLPPGWVGDDTDISVSGEDEEMAVEIRQGRNITILSPASARDAARAIRALVGDE
jgi:phosphotransferase system HPr-like phosphotransfer protein